MEIVTGQTEEVVKETTADLSVRLVIWGLIGWQSPLALVIVLTVWLLVITS